jgi:hypothetical protein
VLSIAAFGPGVQVMGAGRDGGRDLYHRGSLIWQRSEDGLAEVWDGYTVMPVKHMATPATRHQENLAWLWGQIRPELQARGRSTRDPGLPAHHHQRPADTVSPGRRPRCLARQHRPLPAQPRGRYS